MEREQLVMSYGFVMLVTATDLLANMDLSLVQICWLSLYFVMKVKKKYISSLIWLPKFVIDVFLEQQREHHY